ncbi:MAG: hypothetical protein RLZZ595_1774, partial [Bacteroidota bacterium]
MLPEGISLQKQDWVLEVRHLVPCCSKTNCLAQVK